MAFEGLPTPPGRSLRGRMSPSAQGSPDSDGARATEVFDVPPRPVVGASGPRLDMGGLIGVLATILAVLLIGDGLILAAVESSRSAAAASARGPGIGATAFPSTDPTAAASTDQSPSPQPSGSRTAQAAAPEIASREVVGSWAVPPGWTRGGQRCAATSPGTIWTEVYLPPWWYGPPASGGAWSGVVGGAEGQVVAYAYDGEVASFAVGWSDGELTVSDGPISAFADSRGSTAAAPARIREFVQHAAPACPVSGR